VRAPPQNPQAVFSEVQAAVAASGGLVQIPDLFINMANAALAKQVRARATRAARSAPCAQPPLPPPHPLTPCVRCLRVALCRARCPRAPMSQNTPRMHAVQEYPSALRLYKIAQEKLGPRSGKHSLVSWPALP